MATVSRAAQLIRGGECECEGECEGEGEGEGEGEVSYERMKN